MPAIGLREAIRTPRKPKSRLPAQLLLFLQSASSICDSCSFHVFFEKHAKNICFVVKTTDYLS